MPRPFVGIRVADFCYVAAGPFRGLLFADIGAGVVKVEHPRGGDGPRQWPPPTDRFSEKFVALNCSNASVVLDLKDLADTARARSLVLAADVAEPNRPGDWVQGTSDV